LGIQVTEYEKNHSFTVAEMVGMSSFIVDIGKRVPQVTGKAIDLNSWYEAWIRWSSPQVLEPPTHMIVEAVDEFSATIPWAELSEAVLLYEQEGAPLEKGSPLRLYVPDGSSACLNVKSVVKIHFAHQIDLGNKAVYGYKNSLTVDDLKKK
jgi:hypothetical protein